MITAPPPHRNNRLALAMFAIAGGGAIIFLANRARAARLAALPDDMAPAHASRLAPADGAVLSGRTITISRTVDEVRTLWRDIANLPSVLTNLTGTEDQGDGMWCLRFGDDPADAALIHVHEDEDGIAWHAADTSLVDLTGRFDFREAQGGRGTEVAATLAISAPGGAAGRAITRFFTATPELQGRREMKRLKMFMETGEIATARFHSAAE